MTYLPHDPEQWLRQIRFTTAMFLSRKGSVSTLLAPPEGTHIMAPRGRILLAEDNRLVQKITAGILESDGHKVVVASNGLVGLQLLQDQEFDLAVVDYHMPEMDGMDLIKAYREGEVGKRLPIIMLTASVSTETAESSLMIGATHFIMKPYIVEELLSVVRTLVKSTTRRDTTTTAATQSPGITFDPSALDILLHMGTSPPTVLGVISDYKSNAAALLLKLETPDAQNEAALQIVLHSFVGLAGSVGGISLANYCRSQNIRTDISSDYAVTIERIRVLAVETNKYLDEYALSLTTTASA